MKFEVALLIRAYIMWLEEAPIHREEEWSKYRVAAIKSGMELLSQWLKSHYSKKFEFFYTNIYEDLSPSKGIAEPYTAITNAAIYITINV